MNPSKRAAKQIPNAADGTCEWIYSQPIFRNFLVNTFPDNYLPLFVITAEPWCGKTVLARFLVKTLPNRIAAESKIYHHFFGNDDDDRFLNVIQQIERELKQRADEAVKPRGEVICILDALDECKDKRVDIKRLEVIKSAHQSPNRICLKVIAIARDDWYNRWYNSNCDMIPRLPDNEQIPPEVVRMEFANDFSMVVGDRIERLGIHGHLDQIQQDLQLDGTTESPYLWANVVFDVLGELHGSNFEAMGWGRRIASSKEHYTIYKKMLKPFAGNGLHTPQLKGHEHPLYETVRKLLLEHLQTLLGVESPKLRFRWHPDGAQREISKHAVSVDGPTLAVVGNKLYAVWRAHDDRVSLWWARIDKLNGEWSKPEQIGGAKTDARPSIAPMGNKLFALWKDSSGEKLVYSILDCSAERPAWDPPVHTKFGSRTGPAVTSLGKDKVAAVWSCTRGDELLWRAEYDSSSPEEHGRWTSQYPDYIDIDTESRPALVSCRERRYLAWRSCAAETKGEIFVSLRNPGSDVSEAPLSVQRHCHSNAAPSLARYKDKVYVGWRGKGNDFGIWLTSLDRSEKTAHFDLPQRLDVSLTDSTPALVEWGDKFVLAWKGGWDNDTRLWWGYGTFYREIITFF